jgi:hypothetical protein
MVDAARALIGVQHKGLKGRLREVVIRDLLRPLFPTDIGLGSGEIVDTQDRHSTEQDIVIYDKAILPPFLLEERDGLFPVESVLYTIEVKSVLDSGGLRKSHQDAKQLDDFYYAAGEYNSDDCPIPGTCERIIPCVFAFASDLSGNGADEVERYDGIWQEDSDEPVIRVLCVVDRDTWSWWPNQKTWRQMARRGDPLEEVVAFVAGILNTYSRVRATRGQPRIGLYWIP